MPFFRVSALLCAAVSVVSQIAVPLCAVDTQTWEHSEAADFEKGTRKGVSLSSDGHLTTAPLLKEIPDPSVTFLWAIARDSKGVIYAGGGGVSGSKAKLVAIDNTGRVRTVELDGLAVQAIAIDKQDHVYAATSPDGKIYRIPANEIGTGEAKVFYDPKAKYIWSMVFAKSGDLYVGTGDAGEIHKVTPAGVGSVFYKTEESNVRSLAMDANDNLIAGTDASGLILRITPKGEGFVLHEAAKREITALAIAADGTIYAAGTGNKTAATAPAAPAQPARQVATSQGTITIVVPSGNPSGGNGRGGANPAAPTTIAGGSEVYRIQPDGYTRRIWEDAQNVVYALAFDEKARLVLGTGNQGNVFRLDGEGQSTKLLNVAPAQVTAFTTGPNGRLYLATGNIGQVYSMGPDREPSGTYVSEVLDASAFSYWGRMSTASDAKGGAGAEIKVETRSGNVSRTQKDWSPWLKLNGERIASPPARFLQYRLTLTNNAEVNDVMAAYEGKNVAPRVEMVEATPANYKFPAPVGPNAAGTPAALTLPALGKAATAGSSASSADSGVSPALTWNKGYIGARWLANDDNGDTLRFTLEIRGDNESTWKPLHAELKERYYSWDSTAFPDGKYRVRVTASDAPSNTPEQTLTASHESDRFLIDNTAPEITGLTGARNAGKIDVRFHAKDAWNVLQRAEYSLNGGEWTVVEPTTRLTDSEEHDYTFRADAVSGEVTVAVRVSDAYDNEAVVKTVVK